MSRAVDTRTPKERALDILVEINKRGESSGQQLAYLGTDIPPTEFVPTGNILIDAILLGGYGIPRGTLVQLLGAEGSGKSRLCKGILAAAQRYQPDKCVAIVPAERQDYTREGLQQAAIDPERLIIVQGGCAEDSFQAILDLVWDKSLGKSRGLVSAWAIDSLPALVPNAEQIVEDLKDSPVQAPHATLFHRTLRTLSVKQADAIGILVNQTREGRATRPGLPTPKNPFGGKAVRHWPKLTLELTKFDPDKTGKGFDEQWDSFQIAVRAIKNNIPGIGAVGAQIYYRVYLRPRENGRPVGVDHTECLIRAATQLGLVRKNKGWMEVEVGDKVIKQNGEANFANAIEDAGFVESLEKLTLEAARKLNDAGHAVYDNFVIDKETGELLMGSEAEDREVEEAGDVFKLNPEDFKSDLIAEE